MTLPKKNKKKTSPLSLLGTQNGELFWKPSHPEGFSLFRSEKNVNNSVNINSCNNHEKRISIFITHLLIFECGHWLKHITWYEIGRRVSGDTHHPIWYPLSDFFEHNKETNESKFGSNPFNFPWRKKDNRFAEGSGSEIKKLVKDEVPGNTKKSTKYAVNVLKGK